VKISPGVGSSTFLGAATFPRSEVLDLRNDLDIELLFCGKIDQPQSVLIRSTTADGITKSSFMHLNGTIQQIPVFDNQDPLVLQEKNNSRNREFFPGQEKRKRFAAGRFILKSAASVLALVFFISLIAGISQIRIVLTGSMQPAINPGDMLIAVSKDYVKPEVGKVVLYSARDLEGQAVTVWAHRIVDGNATDGFTIQGDANLQPDIGVIPLSDIQTVVVLEIPYVGRLFNVYILALIFSGLFLLSYVFSKRKSE
jgi:signal peptidase I